MGFFASDFVALRPFVYHVLASENVPVLKATRTLWSTAELAERSGRPDILCGRRLDRPKVQLPEGTVMLRDQTPLSMGNVKLEGGWSAEDLLRELNDRVFLWPGSETGPIGHGLRHAEAYAKSDILIRFPFRDVVQQGPAFCKYNSGSPRCTQGRASPRGPTTFLPADLCDFRPSQVVEVTFVGSLALPENTKWRGAPGEAWQPLFAA